MSRRLARRIQATVAASILASLYVSAVDAADAVWEEGDQDAAEVDREKARFPQTSSTGSLLWTSSPHGGRIHVDAGMALYTGDYFRGRYGGVPADLERLSYRVRLGGTVEVLRAGESFGPLEALSLSLGTINALTDPPAPDEDIWYTNDRYIGLGADFGGVLAGVTYSAYTNPLSGSGPPREIAAAVRYSAKNWLGALRPQIKAAETVGSGTGRVVVISAAPAFKPLPMLPVTVTTSVAIGAGFDGYYAADVDQGYFTEIGLVGSLPLTLRTAGRWTLSAGSSATLRSQSIVDATSPYDDAGNVVVAGFVAVSFTY